MNQALALELFGYLGSFLVLISMLMTSVVRLRIINLIGSAVFAAYAILIRSYPTALLNGCLVLINLYHLLKLRKSTGNSYEFQRLGAGEGFAEWFLRKYGDDIKKYFPALDPEQAKNTEGFAVFYENQNENGWMLQIDNNYVSLSAEICADCTAPEDGPAYFFEYGTDSTPDNYLRTLCRYEDGTVTRIADNVDYSSFTLDKKTGSFAFVRQMPDSDYCIFTGDGTSCALEDCTQLTVSPKAPVIYKCNQTIDSVIYD